MIYHESLSHPGLTRVIREHELKITKPWAVRVSTTKLKEGDATFSCFATIKFPPDDEPRATEHTTRRNEKRPHSPKQTAIDESAQLAWRQIVIAFVADARALLDDPEYRARQAEVEQIARAHLSEAVRALKNAVAQIRKTVGDQWLEVGSNSTGSLGNLEMRAAKAQAVLAAKIETLDACFGPYVSARFIAEELLGGPSFGADSSGAPFHFSLHV